MSIKKENKTGIPDQLESGIENLSSLLKDNVRVHHHSANPAQLQAQAFAQGAEIHIASGQEKYLPHEAWHVVQQKQGRVHPTVQMNANSPINEDTGLEKEADSMGIKAASQHPSLLTKYMKISILLLFIITSLLSCTAKKGSDESKSAPFAITGTWKLITGTVVEKGNTVVTDYTKNISFIKIINDTHFAFLQHDLKNGKDSTAVFVSGGGTYSFSDSQYTEHLEYCSARNWEGNDFSFTITLKNDTLIQSGEEKVANTGINRVNTEKYIRFTR